MTIKSTKIKDDRSATLMRRLNAGHVTGKVLQDVILHTIVRTFFSPDVCGGERGVRPRFQRGIIKSAHAQNAPHTPVEKMAAPSAAYSKDYRPAYDNLDGAQCYSFLPLY